MSSPIAYRNFLIYPRTKDEKAAGLTWDDLRDGLTPADMPSKLAADPGENNSLGGGLFVAVKTFGSKGRIRVIAITKDTIHKTKRTPKCICVHHIGGDSRCSLTDARIDRVKREHGASGFKCKHHCIKWQKVAMATGAYLRE